MATKDEISIPANDGVPLHLRGEPTSSIGPKWPPEKSSHGRIKGIYTPSVIETLEQFEFDFFSTFQQCKENKLFGQNGENGYTRISLRAILTNDVLIGLPEEARGVVEAIIPLAQTQSAFTNYSLVYFGANHPFRQSDQHKQEQCYKNSDIALTKTAKNPAKLIEKPTENGYKLEILKLSQEEIERQKVLKEIYDLIARFDYDEKETKQIVVNPNNTIGVAKKDGKIVAVGIAEMSQLVIGKEILTLVELTEASAHKDHLGRGLYAGISTLLIQNLVERSKDKDFNGNELDIVFGECNGSSLGVLITAVYQGRTFCSQVGRELDYPSSGMLPLHVPILDPDEESPKDQAKRNNNLFPTFLNRKTLYELYS